MCSLSKEMSPPTVSVDTVRSKINDDSLRLIDVRREEEYNQGHIPNAVNLPLASLLSGDSPESTVKLFEEMGIGIVLRLLFMMIHLVHLHQELRGHFNT